MSGPRRKTDRAGQAGAAHAAPLSDVQFDQLLADFRVLEQTTPAADDPIARTGATLATAADRLAHACEQLVSQAGNEAAGPGALVDAIAGLEPLVARVQLRLRRGEAGTFLFGVAGGQGVALPVAEIVDVLAADEAQTLEPRGIPRHPSASWWCGTADPSDDRLWALVDMNGDRALLGLEAYRGIGIGEARPAGGVWRGARGLRATVVLPAVGAGFVPDLGVILAQLRQGSWTS